jgi:hypothetical protein
MGTATYLGGVKMPENGLGWRSLFVCEPPARLFLLLALHVLSHLGAALVVS